MISLLVTVLAGCTACGSGLPTSNAARGGGDPTGATSLRVEPSEFQIYAGDTLHLRTVLEGSSDVKAEKGEVRWTSSDTSVASVDETGVVTGISSDSVRVDATVVLDGDTLEGHTVGSILSPGTPRQVEDLSVPDYSRSDGRMTLEWTEVSDGKGDPADYALRHGKPAIEWENAASTQVIVTGSQVGTPRVFELTGVNLDSRVEFQVRSFRSDEGGGRAYGSLSNVVAVPAPTPSAPSDLSVAAASPTRIEGSFTDNSDNEGAFEVFRDSGRGFSKQFTLPADASEFTDTGLDPETTYRYKVRAVNGNSVSEFTVVASATTLAAKAFSPQLHEPAGFTRITERGFSTTDEDGWIDEDNSHWSLIDDESAPRSPTGVARIRYSAGRGDGYASAQSNRSLEGNRSRLYVEFIIKLSENFECHSFVNKIGYITSSSVDHGSDPFVFSLDGCSEGKGGTMTFEAARQNTNGDRFVTQNVGPEGADEVYRGEWTQIEILLVNNSAAGASDGELRAWVDGVKVLEYRDMAYEDGSRGGTPGFDNIKWAPVWGGSTGDMADDTFYMMMDHFYVSAPE